MNLPESKNRNLLLESGHRHGGVVSVEYNGRAVAANSQNGEVITQLPKRAAIMHEAHKRQDIELLQGIPEGKAVAYPFEEKKRVTATTSFGKSSTPMLNDLENALPESETEIEQGKSTSPSRSPARRSCTTQFSRSDIIDPIEDEEGKIVEKEEVKEELEDDSTACNSIEIDIEDSQEKDGTKDINKNKSKTIQEAQKSMVISFPSRNAPNIEKDDSLSSIQGHQRKPHHILMERIVLIMVIVLVTILAIGLATLPKPSGIDDFVPTTTSTEAPSSAIGMPSLPPAPATITPP